MGTITGPGLMWKDLSIQTIEAYLALPDAQRRIDFVRSNCLEGLPANVITNPERVNIVLDLYYYTCLLYTSPSPRDVEESRMPSSA